VKKRDRNGRCDLYVLANLSNGTSIGWLMEAKKIVIRIERSPQRWTRQLNEAIKNAAQDAWCLKCRKTERRAGIVFAELAWRMPHQQTKNFAEKIQQCRNWLGENAVANRAVAYVFPDNAKPARYAPLGAAIFVERAKPRLEER